MDPAGRALYLFVPFLAAGVVAAIVSFSSRGDAAFTFGQQHPHSVGVQELELLVAKAREPTPSGPGSTVRTARCVPGSATGRRNPWRCTVRYRSGTSLRYRVKLAGDGSYVGFDPTGNYSIRGCCVSPGTESGG